MRGKHYLIALSLTASTQLLMGADVQTEYGTINGLIRAAYVSQENPDPTADTYSTAVGGWLKYESPDWNGFKAAVAGYASQKARFATGDQDKNKTNTDFFNAQGHSFAYLGEAYLDYSSDDWNIRIGRQLIETPMINTDEVRMLPNTFEAAVATYSGIDKSVLTAGFIKRWAGYDSPRGHNDSINKFKKFGETHESNGAYMFGITNESIDKLSVQGWFYAIDEVADKLYADAAYTIVFCDDQKLELAAQAAHLNEDQDASGSMTNMDGDIIGASLTYEWGMATLNGAVNQSYNKEGKSVSLGLGGGPYYTSMEEWTVDGMEDVRAYRGALEINLSGLGAEGVVLSTAYGVFRSKPANVRVNEWDIVATYGFSDAISADVSYAMINDRNDNAGDSSSDAGYNRFLARLNYRF